MQKAGRTRTGPAHGFFYGYLIGRRFYPCNSLRSACGVEVALAMAATEDFSSTCSLLRLAASVATLASRRSDSDEEKLVICELARSMAYCNLFSPAPTAACVLPSWEIAN